MNIQTDIGNKIRTIRQSKKISLRDFEAVTGIARGDLSKIETGKRNATLETIQRICKALKVDARIIFR